MTSIDSPLIEYYPIKYKLETLNKIFYWQCHPILPIIDDKKIRETLNKVEFNKNEIKRNIISDYYEVNQ